MDFALVALILSGLSSRRTVMPSELIEDSLRYWGSSPKIRRLQGALLLMRSDRSLNSFFMRVVELAGVVNLVV